MNIDERLSKGVYSFFLDSLGEEDFAMYNWITTYHFHIITNFPSKWSQHMWANTSRGLVVVIAEESKEEAVLRVSGRCLILHLDHSLAQC